MDDTPVVIAEEEDNAWVCKNCNVPCIGDYLCISCDCCPDCCLCAEQFDEEWWG